MICRGPGTQARSHLASSVSPCKRGRSPCEVPTGNLKPQSIVQGRVQPRAIRTVEPLCHGLCSRLEISELIDIKISSSYISRSPPDEAGAYREPTLVPPVVGSHPRDRYPGTAGSRHREVPIERTRAMPRMHNSRIPCHPAALLPRIAKETGTPGAVHI
ncbi:hypothetical protein GQ53DRAFT_413799 [Thozetella sp. PMI_491]|nr:hypothetical protein GQ53DRAFT_413799 [Thozetella sp. PMI_491]